MSQKFAEVAPAIPMPSKGRQSYTYSIPKGESPEIFTPVIVPFGPRKVPGIVLKIHDKKPSYPTKELKPTNSTQLTANQLSFANWIAETMQGGLGYTLRLFTPPAKTIPDIKEPAVFTRKTSKATQTTLNKLEKGPAAIIEKDRQKRLKEIADISLAAALNGEQVLVLVPEKWMIDEMLNSLSKKDRQLFTRYEAGMTSKKQNEVWHAVSSNQVKIIIGTQKALFLPYQKLGLIVMEEEQYETHKLWDQYPRLSNYYAVNELADIYSAKLLYSSSFPSLRLTHLIQEKKVQAIKNDPITLRITCFEKSFEDKKRRRLLPQEFVSSFHTWVDRKEKIFILHNRKGSWQVLTCGSCHKAVSCPNCATALTVHEDGKKEQLQCHHCGHSQDRPNACPSCKKEKLYSFGIGGEKMTEVLQKLAPKSSILFLDASSAKQKDIQKKVEKSQIIIGTTAALAYVQDVSIDRTVWFYPESSLLYPDYRSNERALILLSRLQELTPTRKNVVLATNLKYIVEHALTRPVGKIIKEQLKERKRLKYPPTTDIVLLTLSAKTDKQALKLASSTKSIIEKQTDTLKEKPKAIVGPFQSFIKNRKGKQQAHLLVSGDLKQIRALYNGLSVDSADVDPSRVL